MTLIFDYKTIPRPKHLGDLKVPAIPVRMVGPDGIFETAALVDSGADRSVIFAEQAEVLGLKLDESKRTAVNGIGGKVEAVPEKILLEVSGRGEQRTFKLEVEFYIIISKKEELLDYPVILGRKNFFEHFDVTISESKQKIWLKPILPKGY